MNELTTITKLKRLQTLSPFKNFTIHLASGALAVTAADDIAINKRRNEVIVFTVDGNFHIVNAQAITEIEVE